MLFCASIFYYGRLCVMDNKIKGYFLAIVAAASYGMNPLFALPLFENGMNSISVLFFRYLTSIPLLLIMAKLRGRSLRLNKGELLPLVFIGLMFVLSSITLFSSYSHMDAGIASTLLFVYPIIVALIMRIFYKEKINFFTVVCMLITLLGISLLLKNESGTPLSPVGMALVFISALTYSIYIVTINKSRLNSVTTIKITIYVLFIGLIVLASYLIIDGSIYYPTEWYLWGNILALALFPTVISLVFTTLAVQYIGSTSTAILGALEPVTALIFGVTVFGEVISVKEWCGIVLIIFAVTLVVAGGSISKPLTHFKKLFPKKIFK